jgi:hypothetical protein
MLRDFQLEIKVISDPDPNLGPDQNPEQDPNPNMRNNFGSGFRTLVVKSTIETVCAKTILALGRCRGQSFPVVLTQQYCSIFYLLPRWSLWWFESPRPGPSRPLRRRKRRHGRPPDTLDRTGSRTLPGCRLHLQRKDVLILAHLVRISFHSFLLTATVIRFQ